jgi:hypothetical protein
MDTDEAAIDALAAEAVRRAPPRNSLIGVRSDIARKLEGSRRVA